MDRPAEPGERDRVRANRARRQACRDRRRTICGAASSSGPVGRAAPGRRKLRGSGVETGRGSRGCDSPRYPASYLLPGRRCHRRGTAGRIPYQHPYLGPSAAMPRSTSSCVEIVTPTGPSRPLEAGLCAIEPRDLRKQTRPPDRRAAQDASKTRTSGRRGAARLRMPIQTSFALSFSGNYAGLESIIA